jgi:hypothetical protein
MSILVPSWGRSSPAARPAFVAAYIELILGVLVVGFGLAVTALQLVQSKEPILLGGGKGSPMLAFMFFMTGVVGVQLAVAFAVRQQAAWLRIAGVIVAALLALFSVLWTVGLLVWAIAGLGAYLDGGGDVGDLVGMIVLTPIIAWLGYLNSRAASRAIDG